MTTVGEETGLKNHNRVNYSSFESNEEEEDQQENINVVHLQTLISSNEESHHYNFVRSHCSVRKKVCNLVIDCRSCENLVSRKLLDYFNLPTQPHEAPFCLGGSRMVRKLESRKLVGYLSRLVNTTKKRFYAKFSTWMLATFYWVDHGNTIMVSLTRVETMS